MEFETWLPATKPPVRTNEKKKTQPRATGPAAGSQCINNYADSRYVISIRRERWITGGSLKEAQHDKTDLIHRY